MQAKSLWTAKAVSKVADKMLLSSSSESKDKDKKCKKKKREALYDQEGLALEDIWDSDY